MGKYPNSRVHAEFSDWHKGRGKYEGRGCNANCYLTDVDRLWVWLPRDSWPPNTTPPLEPPLAVGDLKWKNSSDRETKTEKYLSAWFESVNAPYYVILINEDFMEWTVIRYKTGNIRVWNEAQMRGWINGGLVPF